MVFTIQNTDVLQVRHTYGQRDFMGKLRPNVDMHHKTVLEWGRASYKYWDVKCFKPCAVVSMCPRWCLGATLVFCSQWTVFPFLKEDLVVDVVSLAERRRSCSGGGGNLSRGLWTGRWWWRVRTGRGSAPAPGQSLHLQADPWGSTWFKKKK